LCCQKSSRRTLEVVDDAVIVLPDAHRSLSIFARWYSMVSTVARDSLEASVERVEAHVDGMPHDDDLMTQGLHHTRPCLSEFAPSIIM
jgi:pyruvate/2-oxoglutarate/acetoin dehydrogenase E1 component